MKRRLSSGALLLLAAFFFATPSLQAKTAASSPGLTLHIQLHDLDARRRPPLERLTRRALRDVESVLHARLEGDLHVDFVGSDTAFRKVVKANGGGAGHSEPWIAGLAMLHSDRVIVRLGGHGLLRTSEVTRHEIAHVAIHALAGQRWLPRWYHEGVSMLVAGEATFDRLKEGIGAAAFGQLDDLGNLDRGFQGNRIAAERAYAVSAGFLRFAVRRTGKSSALADMHRRMALGLDFGPAFIATFGLSPDSLFEIYSHYISTSSNRWTAMLTESAIWSLLSVLFMFAMLLGWLRRPSMEPDEPMDLAAIAHAGEAAMRSGRLWQPPPVESDAEADPTPPQAPAEGMRAQRPGPGAMRVSHDDPEESFEIH